MPEVYVVRAEFGRYTEDFLKGGYAAIGWMRDVKKGELINGRCI